MRKFYTLAIIITFAVNGFGQQLITENLKSVAWTASEKDAATIIKEENITEGDHISKIIREGSPADIKLILEAESLYPQVTGINPQYNPNNEVESIAKNFKPTPEDQPFWSERSPNGVKFASFISTRAISYYQSLSAALRTENQLIGNARWKTYFMYSASVESIENYKINNQIYNDVHVVTMKLIWSQMCGSECGKGFKRTKIVIFNKENAPVAVFIDSSNVIWLS